MLNLSNGTIAIKLPIKGARWRRGFKNIDEAVREAEKEISPPFFIDYVETEE